MTTLWRRIVTGVAFSLAGAIGLAVALPPTKTWSFDAGRITHELGRAYVASTGNYTGRFFRLESDSPGAPEASRLTMYEDGTALGPSHSQHEAIRASDTGAFSHWGDHVLFSASDGSDPRVNGRLYTAESALTLRSVWKGLGVVFAVSATFLNGQVLLNFLVSGVRALRGQTGRLHQRAGRHVDAHKLPLIAMAASVGALCALGIALSAPITPIRTVDVAQGSKNRIISLAYRGTLGEANGPFSICYQSTRYFEFGDTKYFFAQSMKPNL